MSLETECKESIHYFAPVEKQNNAALFGEYADYIKIVITLHRDEYDQHKQRGDTSFSLSSHARGLLEKLCPYKDAVELAEGWVE